jgi:hypothetical protein
MDHSVAHWAYSLTQCAPLGTIATSQLIYVQCDIALYSMSAKEQLA